jgi:predicted RND superfamily exporter protein
VGTDLPIQAAYPASTRTLLAAAAAGAAGFAALAVSPLPFVRHLGLALAAGVLLSTALAVPLRSADARHVPLPATGDGIPRMARKSVAGWGMLVVAAVLAGAGWAVLPGLAVEARPDRLAAGLPTLDDTRVAERVLGASGEVSVRVRADDVLRPDLLAWFSRAEERLVVRFGDRLRPVVSPARLLSWLGPDPTPQQIDAALGVLPRYLTGASIRSDRREAVAVFGLRLGDLSRQAALLAQVKRALPPAPAGAEVELTGLPVAAARAYELLSGGRLAASLAGPALTGIVLVVLLRRRRQALAAVAGAVLAIGWGVLALRVAGLGLSPLTIGMGSLTAAVGAEFTVFALERRAAGLVAPWPGVLAAALTSAAGFASLSLSRLEMLREFGLVLAGSVLLALAAARLVVGPPVGARALPGPDAGSLPTTADSGPAPLGVLPR